MPVSDGLTWGTTSATVNVGESITVNVLYGLVPTSAGITSRLNNLATAVLSGNTVTFTGVSAGTVTIPSGTNVGNTCLTTNAFTLTVTLPEDESYLNKRGLAHFWENIDDLKQNKLTAGAGILITNDVISATGGGTADAIDWGHITGSMSNQTDLTTALAAKANSADLATVATSGDYDDLTNKPTIGNATLTIQKNGTTVNTFTANASSNVTANIPVPTKTSDITNDGSDGTSTYLEADETAYRTTSIPYGQCDNTSTATVFTATVPGITELRDGVCMWLKNGVVTSASGFTININNLGAKPVYNNMAAATRDTTLWNVNYTMFFVYDSTRVEGGCWVLYRGYNSDNNTIGYQVRTNSQSLPMTSVVYRYRLLFTSPDNAHFVPANNSTSTNATSTRAVTQEKINPFGRIFYYGTTASVAADARPNTTALWEQYAIALGYSFNNTGAALTLTSWKPVYLKCAPQPDGSAIIDSANPYVQDLPTTEDGKIYIFLGVAYSATNIELQLDHPIYYYKNGSILLWTGAEQVVDGGEIECHAGGAIQIDNPTGHIVPVGFSQLDGDAEQDGTPTPDAPSPVETVTGRQVVKTTGKNLFGGLTLESAAYCTYTLADNILTITPTDTTHNTALYFYLGAPLPPGDYIFNSQTAIATSVQLRNANIQTVANLGNSYQNKTFTLTETAPLITLNWLTTGSTNPFTVDLSTLQIEVGSTATAYEPYHEQSYEINLGKNLACIERSATAHSMTFTSNGDGSFSMSGTSTAVTAFPLANTENYVYMKAGTYFLSANNPVANSDVTIRLRDSVGNTSSNWSLVLTTTNATRSITFNENKFMCLEARVPSGVTLSDFVIKPQLEAGSVGTSYAQYFKPIELAKIGNSQDYIWNDDGTWKIHKEINEVVLDGSNDETWTVQNSGTANFFYVFSSIPQYAAATSALSNYFARVNISSSDTNVGFTPINDTAIRFRPNFAEISLADWETWLASHTTIVYHSLATPTDTEITDSALIAQLEAIKGSTLYSGDNNIFLVPSAGAQGEIEVCPSFSQLPVATTQRLGAVIVGDGLKISESGVLSTAGSTYIIDVADGAGALKNPFENSFSGNPPYVSYQAIEYLSSDLYHEFTVSDPAGNSLTAAELLANRKALLQSIFRFKTVINDTYLDETYPILIEATPSNTTITESYKEDGLIVCGSFSVDGMAIAEEHSITVSAPLRWSLFLGSDGEMRFTVEYLEYNNPN